MEEPTQDEPTGRNDFVARVYILGGIPALVGFLVLLMWGARSCNLPA